jgi:hypothetical protein
MPRRGMTTKPNVTFYATVAEVDYAVQDDVLLCVNPGYHPNSKPAEAEVEPDACNLTAEEAVPKLYAVPVQPTCSSPSHP